MSTKPAKIRLLETAEKSFAEKGFKGATMRQICKDAGTSPNMIHHYFGSMQGLFDAVIGQIADSGFDKTIELLEYSTKNPNDFEKNFKRIVKKLLNELIKMQYIFKILRDENMGVQDLSKLKKHFNLFFKKAKKSGAIHKDVNIDMLPGFILDRLGSQVIYAMQLKDDKENVILDKEYRKYWLNENTPLFLYGIHKQ